MEALSRYVPMAIVRRYPDLEWDLRLLSNNPNIASDPDILTLDLPNAVDEWRYRELSALIPLDYIVANSSLPWDWQVVATNPTLRTEHMAMTDHLLNSTYNRYKPTQYVDEMRYAQRQGRYSSSVPGVSPLDIKYGILPKILLEKHLPLDYLLEDPDYMSARNVATRNDVTLDKMRQFPSWQWDMEALSLRVPIRDVRNNPALRWNRVALSRNPTITLDDVLNLNLPNAIGKWNWNYLSKILPMDDIRANPQIAWEMETLLQNPQVTVADIAAMIG